MFEHQPLLFPAFGSIFMHQFLSFLLQFLWSRVPAMMALLFNPLTKFPAHVQNVFAQSQNPNHSFNYGSQTQSPYEPRTNQRKI